MGKAVLPQPGRSSSEITRLWWLSLGISGVVVAVVAALLGLILNAARSVDKHATDIWIVGKQIAGNTVSIWMLAKTNEQLTKVAQSARSIEKTATSMDESLRSLARTNRKGT